METPDDGLLERNEKLTNVEVNSEPVVSVEKKKRHKKVVVVEPVEEVEQVEVVPVKVKKPRTEAQIKSFEKARAIRDANREKNKQIKDQQAEDKILTKVLKEKVIKKTASKISKLKNELINTIIESDSDEEYVPEVKKTTRIRKSQSEVKPLITFV
jgi:hypothetical protein